MRLRSQLQQTITLLLCGAMLSQDPITRVHAPWISAPSQTFYTQAFVNRAIFTVRQTMISSKRAYVFALLNIQQQDLLQKIRTDNEIHKILSHPITFWALVGSAVYYFFIHPFIYAAYSKQVDAINSKKLSSLLEGARITAMHTSRINIREKIYHITLRNNRKIIIEPIINPYGPSNHVTYSVRYNAKARRNRPPIMIINQHPDYSLSLIALRKFKNTQIIEKRFKETVLPAIQEMLPELIARLPDVQKKLETIPTLNTLEDYFEFTRFILKTISLHNTETFLPQVSHQKTEQLKKVLLEFIETHERTASEIIVENNDTQQAFEQVHVLLAGIHQQFVYPPLSILPIRLELTVKPNAKQIVVIGKQKKWLLRQEKTTLTITPQREGKSFIVIQADGPNAQTMCDYLIARYSEKCKISQNLKNIHLRPTKPQINSLAIKNEFNLFIKNPAEYLMDSSHIAKLLEARLILPNQAYWAMKILRAQTTLGRTVDETEIASWVEHTDITRQASAQDQFNMIQSLVRKKNQTLAENIGTYMLLLGFFSHTSNKWHEILPVMHPHLERIFEYPVSPLERLELATIYVKGVLDEVPNIFYLIFKSLARSSQNILTIDYLGIPYDLKAQWQFDFRGTLSNKKVLSDTHTGFFDGEVQFAETVPSQSVMLKVCRNPPIDGPSWEEWHSKFLEEIQIAQIFSDLPYQSDFEGRQIRGLKYYGTVDLGGTTNPAYAREPWVETKPLEKLSPQEIRLWLTDERAQQLIQLGKMLDQKTLFGEKPIHISNLRIFFVTARTEHHQIGDVILFPPSQLDNHAHTTESIEQQINRRIQGLLLQHPNIPPTALSAA